MNKLQHIILTYCILALTVNFEVFGQNSIIENSEILNQHRKYDSLKIILKPFLQNHENKLSIDIYIKGISLYSKALFQENAYDEVLSFTTSLKLHNTSPIVINVLDFYKASAQLGLFRLKESRSSLLKLLKKTKEYTPPYDSLIPKIYSNLAIGYEFENMLDSAFFYYQKSFKAYQKLLPIYNNLEGYNTSAGNLIDFLTFNTKHFEEAEEIAKKVLNHTQNKNVHIENHFLYLSLLSLYLNTDDFYNLKIIFSKLDNFYTSQYPYLQSYSSTINRIMAFALYRSGQFQKALIYYNKALNLTSNESDYSNFKPGIYINMSWIYQKLGEEKLSIKHALLAIEASKTKKDKRLYYYYASTAEILAHLKKEKLAQTYLDSSFIEFRKKNITNPIQQTSFYNDIAWIYYKLGKFPKAIYYFSTLKTIYSANTVFSKFKAYETSVIMSKCLINLHRYKEATDILNSVLYFLQENFASQINTQSQLSIARLYRNVNLYLTESNFGRYKQTKELKYLKLAYKYLNKTDNFIDVLRSDSDFDKDRIAMSDFFYEYTNIAVSIASNMYEKTGKTCYRDMALIYSQKGKSFALLQGVNDRKWKIEAGVSNKLIKKETEIKGHLKHYQKELSKETLKNKPDSLILNYCSQKVENYMNQLDSLNSIIIKDYPKYASLKYTPQYLSSSQIQERLGSNKALIDYYLGDSTLTITSITTDTITLINQKLNKEFYNELECIISEISNPFYGNKSAEEIIKYARCSYSIYQKLLSANLNVTAEKELIICPHKELAYLPFEVLLTAPYQNKKPAFKEFPWLINAIPISYAYNAALLPQFSDSPENINKVIAFAPEYKGTQKLHDSILVNLRSSLNEMLLPIPGTLKEIEAIEHLFSATKFTGNKASKEAFLSHLNKNQVLHLALHSLNDENEPLNSQLVFAPKNDSTEALKAYEIYNYSINSPIIVLSSCNTGKGKMRNGEGLISLARAFVFSGARSQVMTLWSVNDYSGAKLTELFYKKIKNIQNKDIALQNAKIDYIKNADAIKSHPYYWANYVISGDLAPLKIKKPARNYYFTPVIVFIIITLLSILYKHFKN
ncbi:CHAT domain-containing protein [Marinilabiliaceae bacterium JC017]|nr:CHAT domain-containing protein [Marinilabiliaceae bacterium JC017]